VRSRIPSAIHSLSNCELTGDDLARRAYPGSWFNLVAIFILAFSTDYVQEHSAIFYSVLAAHIILSGSRIWLLRVKDPNFEVHFTAIVALVSASTVPFSPIAALKENAPGATSIGT